MYIRRGRFSSSFTFMECAERPVQEDPLFTDAAANAIAAWIFLGVGLGKLAKITSGASPVGPWKVNFGDHLFDLSYGLRLNFVYGDSHNRAGRSLSTVIV
jgi:hypothetical protein